MSHAQDAAMNIASTIQSASIKKHPSPKHDIAPSTAADAKEVVELDNPEDVDELSDVGEDEIPVSILRPVQRGRPGRPQMPPLPGKSIERVNIHVAYANRIVDLRFEQSCEYFLDSTETMRYLLTMPITCRPS